MILVVGATGDLGAAICRRLRDRGLSVRGLVRTTSNPAKACYLQSRGIITAQGDLKDRDTLDAACQGAEVVITTATAVRRGQLDDTIQDVDQAGHLNLVDAAQSAGVRHFIYVSCSGHPGTTSPFSTAKRTVEQHLMQSNMTYTILRPSVFMEVWLSPLGGFDYLNARAMIYGTGNNRLSWISRSDVAAFTVAALNNPAAYNAILELGGPETLSPLDVVRIFERATGKPFEVRFVPEEVLRVQQAQATDSVQQSLGALMLDYAHGDVIDMQDVLHVFPIRLLSVADYARHVLVSDLLLS